MSEEIMQKFPVVLSIAVVTLVIVQVLKQGLFKKAEEKRFIPILSGIVGGALGLLVYFTIQSYLPVTNWFDALTTGIVSGFGATGLNQVFKLNSKEKEE